MRVNESNWLEPQSECSHGNWVPHIKVRRDSILTSSLVHYSFKFMQLRLTNWLHSVLFLENIIFWMLIYFSRLVVINEN